jgi:hypothetical protein
MGYSDVTPGALQVLAQFFVVVTVQVSSPASVAETGSPRFIVAITTKVEIGRAHV